MRNAEEVQTPEPVFKTSIPNSILVVRQINEIREVIRRMKAAPNVLALDLLLSEKLQKAAEN